MRKSVIKFTRTWRFHEKGIKELIKDYEIDMSQEPDDIEEDIWETINNMDISELEEYASFNLFTDVDMDIDYQDFEEIIQEIKRDS